MFGRVIKLFAVLFLVCSLIFLGYKAYFIHNDLHSAMIDNGKPFIIEIKPNSTASAIVHQLKTQGFIESEQILLNYIKWKKIAAQFKAGVYEIEPGDSALDFLEKIIQGKVLIESLAIIEGTTLAQVEKQFTQTPYLYFNPDDFKLIIGNHETAEGLLLADTYRYNAGSDAKKIIQLANKNLLKVLNEAWQQRAADLPYKDPYDLLIVASILEKEASIAEERGIISGVIVNRLKKHMPLQMDPTVIYAMGPDFKGKLTHADLAINSAYNTYRNKGLPPTPIAMVGKNAIFAAAQPEKTNYLYYVAKGDGSHYFSTNYDEQRRAIFRYLIKGHE
ncbi:endolytic transglycosylase MltG [Legionella quinlivanii]|uniref:endolytic transglycosylase MltG n=1 Tax=Legionella quinlivanii TaxID=45073 RepID=UPI0022436DB7|nr:endolytic transglycosylase MltG [Legionella quinlivanii]MCW8450830.1 endolytic transglycosylase MltG [Legionella quinlivanii]